MELRTYTDADDVEISYRTWRPVAETKGIVQIAHGASEHSGRYDRFATFLNEHGYVVYAEDHRGHGLSRDATGIGRAGPRGWDGMIDDVRQLGQLARDESGDHPYVLFAHSMGSFLGQLAVQRYGDELDGVVLSGSSGSQDGLADAIAFLDELVAGGGGDEPAAIFGPFNEPFEPARTPYDWLSRDEAEVDKYIADPFCGDDNPLTFGLVLDMLRSSQESWDPANERRVPKDLPVLFITGAEDPVSSGAKTVHELEARYRELGLTDVSAKYYPEARHELLNEINRDEVQADVLAWLDRVRRRLTGRVRDDLGPARRELADVVGHPHLLEAADEKAPYETDWTGRFSGHTPAVVRPADVVEVAAVLEICRRHEIALVPQGGNTGLVGGGVPRRGELVVSLRRLDRIDEVDTVARQVTVGAGAIVGDVQAAAAGAGLRYAVDLAARDSATVGGTVATNAGGLHLLRYGGTREQLLGVEAVLGTGDVVRRLTGLLKDNTGYHFPSILCGSEGTLGIVTAARLRLIPRMDERVVALVAFGTVADAVESVAAWRSELDSIEAAELFLEPGLELVCAAFGLARPFDRSWPVYVLVEAADRTDPTARLSDAVGGGTGVRAVAVASNRARRAALWRYREDHTLAINTLGPPHKFDVTLPIEALAAFVDTVGRRIAAVDPAAQTWIFGHVGDGNVHVNVTGLAPDDDRAGDVVLEHVVELGGSISAEHGIGTAKVRWLHLDRSPGELAAMRAIKDALDPDHVLNPHVLLPPP